MVTKKDITSGLQNTGLAQGDLVLVHSSLSSFGRVDGGAETVIDGLMEHIGETGGILMPNFPKFFGGEYGLAMKNSILFDLKKSPSAVGKITDIFWQRPGVIRSTNPTHSVAAWGERALKIIPGHENCLSSCGKNSPFYFNCLNGGKILLMGVNHNRNTTLHTVEDSNGAPTRSTFIYYPQVVDYEGRVITVPTRPHLPGLARRYDKMDKICDFHKIQTQEMVGKSLLKLIQADQLFTIGAGLIKENPLFLIDMQKMY